jgi:hypothetical protein
MIVLAEAGTPRPENLECGNHAGISDMSAGNRSALRRRQQKETVDRVEQLDKVA